MADLAEASVRDHSPAPPEPPPGPLDLHWLPPAPDWTARIRALEQVTDPGAAWRAMVRLANTRLDFIRTTRLDRCLQRSFRDAAPSRR